MKTKYYCEHYKTCDYNKLPQKLRRCNLIDKGVDIEEIYKQEDGSIFCGHIQKNIRIIDDFLIKVEEAIASNKGIL